MSRRRASRHLEPPTITELAVDPADVDAETYPVRIRLSRSLSGHEAQALAALVPGTAIEPESVVVPDARLDDVAHASGEWTARLEQATAVGDALDGQSTRDVDDARTRMREDHRNMTRESSVQNYMH